MEKILSQYPFKQTDANNNLNVKSELECLLHTGSLSQCPETISLINARYSNQEADTHSAINNGYFTISEPTPLQYFISSMKTTSTKRKQHEIEDIWCCIKLLLLNGALPASYLQPCLVHALQSSSISRSMASQPANTQSAPPPTYTLHLLHEFRRLLVEHVTAHSVMYQRLNFFFTAIACNAKAQCMAQQHADDIHQSILTYNCYDNHVWIMCDLYAEQNIDEAIPSPKLLELYLEQQFDILHLFDSSRIGASYDYNEMARSRIPYKYKQSMIRHLIQTQLKRRKSVAKYLFVFREFNRSFRSKKVSEFCALLADIDIGEQHDGWRMNHDVVDLLLSFIYDDMHYLKYDSIEKDREFVNESLKMYTYLNTKWKQYIFNNYILAIPKSELAKLDSFAYLCYL